MKISIITVAYNNQKYVGECIESVLNQTHHDIEYIVIDGASTDGTLDVINKYKDRIFKIVSEPDKGIYDAINKGIDLATGDIIGILNSDDMYASDMVLERVNSAFESSGAQSCYGDLVYVSQDKSRVIRYWKSGEYNEELIMKGWMPPHPTFFVKRVIYDRLGRFNTDLKIAADYDLILRFMAKGGITTFYLPEVLVNMRIGGHSNRSIKNIALKMKEDWSIMKSNGLTNPSMALLYKNFSKVGQFFRN
ncbi:MAG: glycosyl transferase [Thermodesulfobacteriota bacterium]|nr:MAG: glycosyl transferase [Thermodesulfobacteriota bacterium]